MAKKPATVVLLRRAPSTEPPRVLGDHGRSLWDRILAHYRIDDAGGIEMLCQACQAADRAERLRTLIDEEGEVVVPPAGGLRVHPCPKDELAARAFVVKTLGRLGLDVEPLKGVGPPWRRHRLDATRLEEIIMPTKRTPIRRMMEPPQITDEAVEVFIGFARSRPMVTPPNLMRAVAAS